MTKISLLTSIDHPRFNQQLMRLQQNLNSIKHELWCIGGTDILFIPSQQLAYIATGTNPVARHSAPSPGDALALYNISHMAPKLTNLPKPLVEA